MTADLTEGMLQTDRLSVHFLRSRPVDAAARVLFLGGSNFDLRYKRGVLNSDLVHHFDIATYEPRGIGRTEQPDGAWTMEDYARDAIAVMDALGWQDACIIGESFGGMTSLHVALIAPDRVRRMVIASATAGGPVHRSFDISTFLDLPRETAAAKAMCLQDTRLKNLQDTAPDTFARKLAERVAFEAAFADPSITSGGYARLLEARRDHDVTAHVADIKTPTTVIAGAHDMQADPRSQHALAADLPNAVFHQFDAGHGVLFAAQEAVTVAIDALRDATVKTANPVGVDIR